jgi:hypothetical protein
MPIRGACWRGPEPRADMQCPCAFASCEDALAALDTQPRPMSSCWTWGARMSGIEGIRHLKARSPARTYHAHRVR